MSTRGVRRVLLWTAAAVLLLVAIGVIVTQTPWFRGWLQGVIVRETADFIDGELEIGRLEGNLFTHATLRDVVIRRDDEALIEVRRIDVRYDPITLIRSGIVIDSIRLESPRIVMRLEEDGWTAATLFRREVEEPEPDDGPGPRVEFGRIEIVDGTVPLDLGADAPEDLRAPDRIEDLDGVLAIVIDPDEFVLTIEELAFRAREPDLEVRRLTGRVTTREDDLLVEDLIFESAGSRLRADAALLGAEPDRRYRIEATGEPLSLPEIARFVAAVEDVDLQPTFRARAEGPAEALDVAFELDSAAGGVRGALEVGLDAPQRAAGTLSVHQLDLAPLLRDPAQQSEITAEVAVDLIFDEPGPSGRIDVQAPLVRVAAYEATGVDAGIRLDAQEARFTGTALAFGGALEAEGLARGYLDDAPLSYHVTGRVRNVDLRQVPDLELEVDGEVTSAFEVDGRGERLTIAADLDRSIVAGMTVLPGSTARVELGGPQPVYDVDARLAGIEPRALGRTFDLEALEQEGFGGSLDARIAASGAGTDPETLVADVTAELTNVALSLGRSPRLELQARLDGGALNARVRGPLEDVDPGLAAGRDDLRGRVAGEIDLRVRLDRLEWPPAPEEIAADGRIALEPSVVADVALDRLLVSGTYADGLGVVDELTLESEMALVEARGPIALTGHGWSRLDYRVEVRDLEQLGQLIDQPELRGILVVEGVLTGNREAFRTEGTVKASTVQYGDAVDVLSASADFDAQVPDLDFERAAIETALEATFVSVPGLELRSVDATVEYLARRLSFELDVLDEQGRRLTSEGQAVIPPDRPELRLRRLSLSGEDEIEWSLPPGHETRIAYYEGLLEIDDFVLLSGVQAIRADGALWLEPDEEEVEVEIPPEGLEVRAEAVDLERLQQLIGREPDLTGHLDAEVVLRGEADGLRARGELSVTDGAVRDLPIEEIEARVDYSPAGLELDARLIQTPEHWLRASGTLPPEAVGAANGVPPARLPLDLAVTSSTIDLGIVEGLTAELSDVAGLLRADLRVHGTIDRPLVEGELRIEDGALTVEALGSSYEDVTALVRFAGEHVAVERVQVRDQQGDSLTLAGRIDLPREASPVLDLRLEAAAFDVLDGELGDIDLNIDLAVGGTLQAPIVEGEIAFVESRIEVDELLQLVSPGVYDPVAIDPTRPDDAVPGVEPAGATLPGPGLPAEGTATGRPQPEPDAPQPGDAAEDGNGLFDQAALDVSIRIPENLLLRGDDLRLGARGMGLGALNLTVGGTLRVTKVPGEEVLVVGTIETVRGFYDFQGRRFDIQRGGAVRFEGVDFTDAGLDLVAIREIAGVEARVHITGTVEEPMVSLSSVPSLDEADILSLVVFNRPLNELGSGERTSLSAQATAMAAGAVADRLAESLRAALDLDLLEVDATGEAGPVVTIGERIGERVFVRIRRQIGADEVSEFALEYRLTDLLRLQAALAEGAGTARSMVRRVERGGFDLVFAVEY